MKEKPVQKSYWKNFIQGGSYSTELVDFYLVDPDTLQVVDEHKTTW